MESCYIFVPSLHLHSPRSQHPAKHTQHELCGSQEDIEKWHAVYCQKLTELFDTYKGRNPDYKHKELIIK